MKAILLALLALGCGALAVTLMAFVIAATV